MTGAVIAVHDGDHREVQDAAGVVWALVGRLDEPVAVGETVRWRIKPLDAHVDGDDGMRAGTVLSSRTDSR